MDRNEIKNLLPHREPMLLVDEIYEDADGVAHGRYTVRGDEWFLQGHFPNNPVVPGVIQCEIMGQACAVLLGNLLEGKAAYYTGLDRVKFRQMVRPGDTIEVSASLTRSKHPFYFAHARATVGGKLCCEGDLSFAITEGR